jgi:DNA-binding Lrp family transcriptional regulator
MATTPSKSSPFDFLKKLLPAAKDPAKDQLQSFGERQESERAYDSVDRGTSMVPLDRIVGSVGRYRDFDSEFNPKRNQASDERLQAIIKRMREGKSLPPVSVYQIKDDYFILDGHHRVTAAKELGHTHIRACILELLPSADTLENRLYVEKTEFRDKAGLPRTIDLTELGQLGHLQWQIREHQSHLSEQKGEDISYKKAAADWYRTIYRPLATLISNSGLVNSFKNRTVDDLYLYISVHQWEKGKERKYGIGVDKLIPKDMEEFRNKMAEHKEQEYPEMRREITAFILLNVEGKHEQRIFDKLVELDEVREVHSVHGSIDIIIKVVLTRDLLSSDAELLTQFLFSTIRQWRGVRATQTLLPGMAIVKKDEE